ncbi:MAG: IS66 family transposase [Gammaproteobacteria bacterium]|nr:IS66 family transposase [Gammaproteobacteria bacterium]
MTALPSITPGADGSVPMAVVSAALAEMESRLDEERSARRTAQERAKRQKAEAVRLGAENADLSEQIRRLECINDEFRKLLFGKKSEKLPPDDRQLSFEDLGIAAAEADVEPPAEDGGDEGIATRRRRKRPARSGLRFPEHVERRTEVIEPESTLCPCGCGEMAKIGEDRSERLDFVPAKCVVIETVRPRYACNRCKGGGVVQAPAPPALIEGGLPTEALLAHVIVSKFADHLPLYRQAQIFARQGIEINRATLADWVGKASFHLRPLVDCLAADLKASGKLVLDPGRGKTKQGYMWTMVRDERPWSGSDPPGVVYGYAPGRGGKHGEALLEGFSGTLQVDGYSGYNRLRRHDRPGGALTLADCWTHARRGIKHARRGIKEVHDSSGSPIAREGSIPVGGEMTL